jgi:hypothetical protein
MEQRPTNISRRRLLVGSAAGATAVWAAPAISTLGSASAAGSDCTVFKFVSADLVAPTWTVTPQPTYGVGTILTTSDAKLLIAIGDIDLVGNNTPWPTSSGFPDKSIDLNGSSGKILTVLSTNYPTPLSLPAGTYNVTLKVYGSIGPDNNIIGVHIGPDQAIGPAIVGPGPSLFTLTGSVTGSGGIIRLTHTSTRDNRGLFLVSLEVSIC